MTTTNVHAPGTVCWAELATTDDAAAKKFYSALFGWETKDTPAGDAGDYTLLRVRGRDVGALYSMRQEERARGVVPHWLLYFAVASADEATKRAAALGGTVLMGPFDVMDHGRMSVFQDPSGASFAVWQAMANPGAGIKDEPGSVTWCELITRDSAAAGGFYPALFGWTRREVPMPGMTYTLFCADGPPTAGMMEAPAEWGDLPSHWLTYFEVDDCDARTGRAQGLGGTVCLPPKDVPGVGRFSIVRDPQGADFAMIRMNPPA